MDSFNSWILGPPQQRTRLQQAFASKWFTLFLFIVLSFLVGFIIYLAVSPSDTKSSGGETDVTTAAPITTTPSSAADGPGNFSIYYKNYCMTSSCISAAHELMNNMDRSVDPCEDFYKFSCGGFLHSKGIAEGDNYIDIPRLTEKKIQEQLEKILTTDHTDGVRKDPYKIKTFMLAKNLYKSCINNASKDDITNLQSSLKQIQDNQPDKFIDPKKKGANVNDYTPHKTPKYDKNELLSPLISEKCIAFVQKALPISVGALYARYNFLGDRNATIKDTTKMVEKLQTQLSSMIQKSNWITKEAKKNFTRKIELMRIAYPPEFFDDALLDKYHESIDFDKKTFSGMIEELKKFEATPPKSFNNVWWTKQIQTTDVNTFFDKMHNEIVIPAGILQNSSYYKNLPKYMKYGAFGSVIGHALIYDFSSSTNEEFDKEVEKCTLIPPNPDDDPISEDVELKNRKNLIAEIAGFKAAYDSWSSLNADDSTSAIPGFGDYSQKKMLWISFANTLCSNEKHQGTKSKTQTKFRLNAVAKNLPDFAEAFQCAADKSTKKDSQCKLFSN